MNIKKLKYSLLLCFVILAGLTSKAGNQIGTWKNYRAYHSSIIIAETPNLVFAVYRGDTINSTVTETGGSLLSYNPEDDEVITYSFEDGLNDANISFMKYSPEANTLVLVYDNANIDLFSGRNNVHNLAFIKDHQFIQDKTVNDLELIDGYAYVSGAFGIAVVDVQRKEIKATYNTGSIVKSLTKYGDYFYALTSDGVKRGLITSNLLDKENWELVTMSYPGNFNSVKRILFFRDKMVIAENSRVLYRDDNGNINQLKGEISMSYTDIIDDRLVVVNDTLGVYFYSDLVSSYDSIPMLAKYIIPSKTADTYWLAKAHGGIVKITYEKGSQEYTVDIPEITVNSPKRNLNFYMTCRNNRLYIVGGYRDSNRKDYAGTLMILENNRWFNLDESLVEKETGLDCLDFLSIAIDPADPEHYFVSAWGEGVYEFQNNEFVQLLSHWNTTLQSASSNRPNIFVRVDGLVYDRDRNLWMVSGGVPNGLNVMTPEGKWESFYHERLSSADPNRILITGNNQKWFNIWRGNKKGLLVVDSDGNEYYSTTFTDQQGKETNATAFLCMAEDLNGTVWVGTDIGPITFSSSSPQQVQNGICYRIISEDEYDYGYYLLENQKVTAIAVDGGNRKWLGTDGGGLFVVDQSDPEKILVENFTAENSYLLSNTINSIAINDITGEVFIGTDIGLCSYMSEAIEGKSDYSDVYAFPNPVYLSRHNQVVVTGLIRDSNVKITDMAGNIVKEGTSMGGQYLWNCTDRFGSTVKAGMYLVFAANSSGSEGVVTKIVVIK